MMSWPCEQCGRPMSSDTAIVLRVPTPPDQANVIGQATALTVCSARCAQAAVNHEPPGPREA